MVKLCVKITGANGYLGNSISKELKRNGHKVSGIKRELLYGPSENLKTEISNSDVILNLAGAPVLQRWTNKNKRLIYDSRIICTRNLVNAINLLLENEQPKKFISASAIGIYEAGSSHSETSTNFAPGFIGKVVKDWENSLDTLPISIQKNILRIGLVLGKDAKTIKNLLMPFKLGLGGKIGKGKQAFPFIHEKDLVNAFVWAIEKHEKSGVFNLVAPENISNTEFTLALAKHLHRPTFIPVPEIVLNLFLGEAASLLLQSPVVEPKALLEARFEFQYPSINSALSDILP